MLASNYVMIYLLYLQFLIVFPVHIIVSATEQVTDKTLLKKVSIIWILVMQFLYPKQKSEL